jgi:hypothetical protein
MVPSHGARVINGDTRFPPTSARSGLPTRGVETRLSSQVLATRVGLRFADTLTFEGWESAGRQILRVTDSSCWWLGDWVAVGRAHFTDRYQQAMEAAGLDYQTIRNYAWVARRFGLSGRRDALSFPHHSAVASLPSREQDYWLDQAESHDWSRNRLRQEIRRSRNGSKKGPKASVLPRISVTSERISRWRTAAEQMDMSLETWIVANLDSSAASVNGIAADE